MIINISFCIFNQIIIIYFIFSFLQHTSAEWWLPRTRMRRMSKQTNDQAQDVFRRIDRKMRRIMGVKTRSNNIILSFPLVTNYIHTYMNVLHTAVANCSRYSDRCGWCYVVVGTDCPHAVLSWIQNNTKRNGISSLRSMKSKTTKKYQLKFIIVHHNTSNKFSFNQM